MKNKILFLSFMIFIGLSGCKKITEFKVENSTSFVIPQTAAIGVPLPSNMSVPTSSSFQFQNNGTDAKHVKEVKLDELTLTITQPTTEDFGFLKSIHIFISADGLQEIELAYLDDVPTNAGNSIDLITTGAVLDEYLKKEEYQLRVQTVTDELLSQDITIRADMVFNVRAKLV
jgi:hypothetical protein